MKKLWLVLGSCLLCFTLSAYGVLDLELTQGVTKAIPIAIASFPGSDIITSDLQNSGRFRVVAAKGKHDYSYWQQQRIDNVILGSGKLHGSRYKISFQLLDVYGKQQLLTQKFTIKKTQLRQLAHHISDLVYKQLLGIRGVFSTKIAYVLVQTNKGRRKYKLMVTDADGYNPHTLLTSSFPIMSPAWAPNGKKIAYVSFENNRAAIYVQDIATGKRMIASKYPGLNNAPSWSPSGKTLAIVLSLSGYPKIYTLNLTTHKIKQLTFGSSIDTEPSWAPDGKSLIFTSSREGSPQIYRAYLKSKDVERLTYKSNYNARASFTPDGKKIVMMTRDDGVFKIATQDLQSGRITILTPYGELDKSPSVAPNGSMIVYATYYGGRGILGEVAIDGAVKLRLPAQEGEVQEPAWSPFF